MAKSRARKLADIIVGAGIDIDGNLTFDGGSTSADLTFADNDKANFGDASDLQIFHNGSHSFIKDAGTGDLYIGASNNLALMNSAFSENYLLATTDGAVNLYYDGSSKLTTTSTGVTVTGQLTASTNLIATTATYSPIVYGGSSNLQLKSNTAEMFAQFVNNGAAELYYDNSKKFETFSGGVSVTGQLNATTMHLPDGGTGLQIGNSNDLTIFHDGTDSFIKNDTGQLILRVASVESALVAVPNGAVSLYYDNSAKLATTSTGIQVTGNIDFPSGATILSGGTNTDMTIGTSSSGSTGLLKLQSTGDIQLFQYGTSWTTNVTFKGDGNVGIGTESPEQKLHVNGTVKIGDTLILREDGTNDLVQSTGNVLYLKAPEFNFQDNSGNQQFYTTSSRNFIVQNSLGVGTNSLVSGAQLTLGGGSRIAPVSGNGLNLAAGGSDRMFISTGGNVGIGTTSPTTSLHVERSSGNATQILNATGNNTRATIETKAKTSGGVEVRGVLGSYGDATKVDIGTLSNHNLSILTNNTERVRFMASGNVGIGTTSPQEKLQINGNLRMFSAGYPLIDIGITTSNYFRFLYDNPNDMFKIGKNGAATLNIAGSGNVGIGTSPAQKLDVNGKIRFTPNTADTNYSADIGALYNSTHPFELSVKNNGSSAEYLGVYADSGGANNRVVFPTGNVGIGTTSPERALHVVGGIHLPNNNIISWDQANGTLRNAMYVDSGDDMIIGDTNFDDIYFSTGQKTKTVVIKQTTGRVGVGTSAPSSLVHASLGNQALGFDAGFFASANPSDYTVGRGAGITMQNADVYVGGIYGVRHTNSWEGALAFFTHTSSSGNTFGSTFTEKMRIDSSGNVGIGTGNTIRAPLQVHNSSTGAGSTEFRISRSVDSSAVNRKIAIIMGTDAANLGSTWKIESESSVGYNDSANLNFIHNAGGSPSTRVTFKANGNVGIGNTNPNSPFDVYNNGGTYAALFYQTSSDTAKYNAIRIQGAMTGVTGYYGIGGSTTSNTSFRDSFVVGTQTAHSFNLATSDTARVTIDSSGNVGIGNSSPTNYGSTYNILHIGDANTRGLLKLGTGASVNGPELYSSANGKLHINTDSNTNVINLVNNNVGIGTASPYAGTNVTSLTVNATSYPTVALQVNDTNVGQLFGYGSNIALHASGSRYITFHTNDVERMRIDASGNLLVGLTSISDATSRTYGNAFSGTSSNPNWKSWGSGSHTHAQFRNGTSVVGSITTTSSATTYNTSSDQRLKENIVDAPSASDDIDAIQVRSFDWKVNGSHQKYGMVAQELQSVAPEAVTGDADSDDMMGVDYSKLVPMLVKEIQSLRARVAELEGE